MVFNVFFIIPVEIQNARLNFAFTILTDAPITVANDAMKMSPVVTDETIMTCKHNQKKQYIY